MQSLPPDRGARRRELLAGTGTLAGAWLLGGARARAADKPAPQRQQDGKLKIGLASYSMRKASLDKVIELCQQLRIKHITLKDVHLPLTSTAAQLAELPGKLAAAGITLAGVGVIYMKTPADVDRAFE